MKRLTAPGFKKWLLKQPVDAVVGTARHCNDCPAARYIQFRTGGLVGRTNGFTWGYRGLKHDHLLPKWAKRFIEEIDELPGMLVLRDDALVALDRALSTSSRVSP